MMGSTSRIPAPLLDGVRCDGYGDAARPRSKDGQGGRQKCLPPLPCPPVRPPPGYEVEGPQCFFDRVLPFGLRSAPFIFNCLAEAIEWAARQEGVTHTHHYLDHFFLASTPGSEECTDHLHTLTSLCNHLGVPLAEEKREGPTTCLEYLGILLDSTALEARLPPDNCPSLGH